MHSKTFYCPIMLLQSYYAIAIAICCLQKLFQSRTKKVQSSSSFTELKNFSLKDLNGSSIKDLKHSSCKIQKSFLTHGSKKVSSPMVQKRFLTQGTKYSSLKKLKNFSLKEIKSSSLKELKSSSIEIFLHKKLFDQETLTPLWNFPFLSKES